jgi:hypothetical protein
MKHYIVLPLFFTFFVLAQIELHAQADTSKAISDTAKFETTYRKLEGMPILVQLGMDSSVNEYLGQEVDFAYRNRNIHKFLVFTSELYKAEVKHGKQAYSVSSYGLLRIADRMMIYRMKFEIEQSLLRHYYGVHGQMGVPVDRGVVHILDSMKMLDPGSGLPWKDHNSHNTNENNNFTMSGPKRNNVGKNIDNTKGALDATLLVINGTAEVLYLYCTDEFIGRLYPDKEKELAIRGGECDFVFAETPAFERVGLEVCIEALAAQKWVVQK